MGAVTDLTSKFWAVVKDKFVVCSACLITFILGATIRGDWLFIAVNIGQQFSLIPDALPEENIINDTRPLLEQWKLKDLHFYVLLAISSSFLIYFGIGGWFQWNYYIKQKDKPQEWKCQPDRFLTKDNEKHEILLGSFNMLCGATTSGTLACYVVNGGTTQLYHSPLERGWLYLILSVPLFYLCVDGLSYYAHALFHTPYLYRTFHKWHHRYYSPTAFGAVAMHPVEFSVYQLTLMGPIFFVPIFSGTYVCTILYVYYYGMIDHSGIVMDAIWPWQPPTIFHDDHHKYFHVNFGFNSTLFDRLHDTLRKKDRVYGEHIFWGKGRPKTKEDTKNKRG